MATLHFKENDHGITRRVWERLDYDWSRPRPRRHADDRLQHVGRTTVVREGKNLKGRSLGLVLGTVGRGLLRKALKNTIKAIEARNNEAKTAEPA
jgi:hypothetical protein